MNSIKNEYQTFYQNSEFINFFKGYDYFINYNILDNINKYRIKKSKTKSLTINWPLNTDNYIIFINLIFSILKLFLSLKYLCNHKIYLNNQTKKMILYFIVIQISTAIFLKLPLVLFLLSDLMEDAIHIISKKPITPRKKYVK